MPTGASRSPTIEDILGPLAAAIMRVVWREGESTVASVTARLADARAHQPAYTTVMTVMGRLSERGLLTREKRGRVYVYGASAPEDAMIDRLSQIALDDIVARFGTSAYRQFAIRLAEVDPETRAKLVDLAAQHDES